MDASRLFICLLLCAAALGCVWGCGKSKPAAEAPPEPVPVNTSSESPAKAASPATSSATNTTATSPPSAADPLRSLLARYLESDGRGGWRKNEQAATDLEKLTAEQLAQLWPLLKDSQVEVRRAAAVFLLAQFDPANSQQVAAFVGLLDDNDRMVRARGLDAVVQFSLADKAATLPKIIPLLDPRREDRPENRSAAIRLCAGLKAAAIEASSALSTAASGDPAPKVRSAALAALAQIAEPSTSVPVLSTALTDQDAAVRLVAATRLRQLGPAAAPAAKALAAALADSGSDVAEAAGEALLRIGPPAVEPLAEQLASSNAAARKLAIVCLAKLGPVAKSAAAAIAKSRQDSDPQIRELAEATLKRLEGK